CVEVKRRCQDVIELPSLIIALRHAELEDTDAFGGPRVGHSRDPTGDSQGAALDDQIVDAAKHAEPIAELDESIGDTANVAGLLLDADDLRYVLQLVEDIGGNVDAIGDGIVVDHDRQAAGT